MRASPAKAPGEATASAAAASAASAAAAMSLVEGEAGLPQAPAAGMGALGRRLGPLCGPHMGQYRACPAGFSSTHAHSSFRRFGTGQRARGSLPLSRRAQGQLPLSEGQLPLTAAN